MPFDVFDLAAQISADTGGVEKNLTETQRKVLELAKTFETTERTAQASAVGMATSMRAVNAELGKMKLANLSADYDKFSNALRNNSATSRMAADDFLKLFSQVTGHSKAASEAEAGTHKLSEALRILGSSAVVAEGPFGGVSSRLRAVAAESGELSSLLGPAGVLVGGMLALGLGALVTGDAILKLSEHAGVYGEEIHKAQVKTGLTSEFLSTLKVITKETGGSFDGMSTAAARMQVAISKAFTEKSGEAEKSLAALGLRTEEFKRSLPDDQLVQVAKKLNEVTNQSDKNRIAQGLLSRGWMQSADALKDLAEHYDEAKAKADAFGLTMSQQDVDAAVKFEHAMKDLSLAAEGFGLQVGERTGPEVLNFLNEVGITLGINAKNWKQWGDTVGDNLAGVVRKTSEWVAQNRADMQAAAHDALKVGEAISNIYYWLQILPDKKVIEVTLNVTRHLVGFAESAWDSGYWGAPGTPQASAKINDGGLAQPRELISGTPDRRGQQSEPIFPKGGGGGHRKGKDPASSALELEKENLKGLEQLYKSDQEAYDRSLRFREMSLQEFVAKSEELELARHAVTESVLLKELFTAEKFKDADKRKLEVQKALNALAAEHYKVIKTVETDEDKVREDRLNRDRINEGSRLAVYEITGQQHIDRAKALAGLGVVTEEQAAKQIAAIDQDLYEKKKADLERQWDLANQNETKQAEVKKELAALEANHSAQVEADERTTEAARQKDLANLRAYADEVRHMQESVLNTDIETSRKRIELLSSLGLKTPKQTRVALAGVDLQAENARFAAYQSNTLSQVVSLKRQIIEIEAKGGQEAALEKLAIVDQYYKRLAAETRAHEQTINQIQLEERIHFAQKLKSSADQIASVLIQGEATIFTQGWKAAFGQVLQGFAQMLLQMEERMLAAQIFKMLIGLGGGIGGFSKGDIGGVTGSLGKGFASGGDFTVGGHGGTDTSLVAFMATPGEQVSIRTPGQSSQNSGGHTYNIHITNNIATSNGRIAPESLDQLNNRMLEQLRRADQHG